MFSFERELKSTSDSSFSLPFITFFMNQLNTMIEQMIPTPFEKTFGNRNPSFACKIYDVQINVMNVAGIKVIQ